MPTSPESAVKKLARLPSNCICANCGTTSKYGFSTVCIKYLTFVCNACKSSHQAVSHRCKSLTMSSWDQGEVLKLKIHGNDYARRVWLANAPPVGAGGRPREGDDINVFKRFVVEAYENKRYYREPPADGDRQRADEGVAPTPKPAPPKQRRPAPLAPAPAPPPAVDLLDFGAFGDAAAPLPSQPAARAAPAASNFAASDTYFDPFDNNTQNADRVSSVPNIVNGSPAAATNSVTSAQSSNNHTFNAPGTSNDSGVSNNNASFDPFGGSLISTVSNASNNVQQPAQKTVMKTPVPVMNNSGGIMNGGMSSSGHGNMMMNGNTMMNTNNNSMVMTGGNAMMMNGGAMANASIMSTGNGMMMNGGMGNMMNNMNNKNGGAMANNSMMSSGNGMMMNGGMVNVMNNMNNNMLMMNGGMANGSNMTSMNGGSGQQQLQQQQHPPPAMNINVMQPMNNCISNNFGARPTAVSAAGGNTAAAKTNQKRDPFAGLGF
eukprot:CAMPEP_0172578432 /NCGR_PEP_ID=MMETSP1067-20121228/138733_1 /TAXON_ID=265564 ORGANISM="Thalassiosira punctigera, Strain Tpunct2005C2" /NCGR_SAMPLE_ID=MMETSP1067 /ASSEMBLY_ACC=CAM_ASM_000444 /LENGTH=489 /DNA_ID=CAMNT_0013371129 /DNA_START=34 /DNA_END=1503 /DNA_ORIENTATION=-